jgi:guanylate kinase
MLDKHLLPTLSRDLAPGSDLRAPRSGLLLVLSGPSGTGKTTLAHRLLTKHGGPRGSLCRSVSLTTRTPRPAEADGKDYRFVTPEHFTALLSAGQLLEHAELYGHRYGTPRASVEGYLKEGRDVLLILDAHGRRQLAATYAAEVVSVFLLPPSLHALQERLHHRTQDDDQTVTRRLLAAREESAGCDAYDYVLVNVDLDGTLEALDTILRAERLRRARPALPSDELPQDTVLG